MCGGRFFHPLFQPMPPRPRRQRAPRARSRSKHTCTADSTNRRWPARAEVDALEHELLAADPEEHDRREQRAQRADVNGHDVHPLRHDGLNAQRDGEADHVDHRRGRHALEAEPLLQGRDRRLIEVDDRRDTRKGHADKKHHRHDAAARHAVHDMDKVDEHQARPPASSCAPPAAMAGMMTNAASSAAIVSNSATLRAELGMHSLLLR